MTEEPRCFRTESSICESFTKRMAESAVTMAYEKKTLCEVSEQTRSRGKYHTRVEIDIQTAKVEEPRHVIEGVDNGGNVVFGLQFFSDRGEFIFMRLSWMRPVSVEWARIFHKGYLRTLSTAGTRGSECGLGDQNPRQCPPSCRRGKQAQTGDPSTPSSVIPRPLPNEVMSLPEPNARPATYGQR